MVKLSTIVILIGIGLLLVPVPPIMTAAVGLPVILLGIGLKLLTEM